MAFTEDDFIFVFPTPDGHTSALNSYFGTNLTDLTECTAPDVQIMPEYLLAYWWNYIIQQVDEGPGRAAVILIGTFIRNIGPAVFDYRAACRYVRRYLSHRPNGTTPMAYDLAVARFDSCILRIGVAIACVNAATKIHPLLPRPFTKGDGSVSERIYLFSNRIKHCGDYIARSADPGSIPTAPLWIMNDGLGCHYEGQDVFVSFAELAAVLQDLSGEADYRAEESPIPAF